MRDCQEYVGTWHGERRPGGSEPPEGSGVACRPEQAAKLSSREKENATAFPRFREAHTAAQGPRGENNQAKAGLTLTQEAAERFAGEQVWEPGAGVEATGGHCPGPNMTGVACRPSRPSSSIGVSE